MKAYKITADIIDEPWHWDDVIVHATKASEAKYKGLPEFDGAEVSDYNEYSNKRYVQYKDLRAHRVPELDKADYRGDLLTKAEIREREWVEKRDLEAFNFTVSNPCDLFLVWAGVYGSYWGANKCGYSSNIERAGKYTAQEAYDIVKGNDYSRQETVVLLSTAQYNKDIDEKIERLKNCKI